MPSFRSDQPAGAGNDFSCLLTIHLESMVSASESLQIDTASTHRQASSGMLGTSVSSLNPLVKHARIVVDGGEQDAVVSDRHCQTKCGADHRITTRLRDNRVGFIEPMLTARKWILSRC